MTRRRPFAVALLAALGATGAGVLTADAATFGTDPIPVNVDDGRSSGPAGNPSISGDDRRGRLVAFDADASDLVGGDTNGVRDVFVWHRPRGRAGTTDLDRPTEDIDRVSVSSDEEQANGPSSHPAVDGSLEDRPHCVAFQSEASNLGGGDRDRTSDVFVRDLRRGRTILVSRGIGRAATDPAIDGGCDRVTFTAGGNVYLAEVGSRPRKIGRGDDPDLSLDGTALVWEAGREIRIRRGRVTSEVVGDGRHPTVSDRERGEWGVSFHTNARLNRRLDRNTSQDVYSRIVRARGGGRRTQLISAPRRGARSRNGHSVNAGISAYGHHRGFVLESTTEGGRTTLYYMNNNSGNTDDLAVARSRGGRPGLYDVAISARVNWVAFTSDDGQAFRFDGNGDVEDVFVKHLIDGEEL